MKTESFSENLRLIVGCMNSHKSVENIEYYDAMILGGIIS